MSTYIVVSGLSLFINFSLFISIAVASIYLGQNEEATFYKDIIPFEYKCIVNLHLLSKDRVFNQAKTQTMRTSISDDEKQTPNEPVNKGLNENQQFEYTVFVQVYSYF